MNKTTIMVEAQPAGALMADGVVDDPGGQAEGDGRHGEARVGDEAQGGTAEADQSVDGQSRQFSQGIFGPAGFSCRPIIIEPDLPKTEETAESSHEPATFREAIERIDDAAVHQAEIAAVHGDLQVADHSEQAIERPVGDPFEKSLPSTSTDRVNDVVAASPESNQVRNQFGRVLQVAVHHDDGLAPGVLEPRRDRRLVAEIPAEVDRDHPLVLGAQAVDHVGSRVSTPIVNEQDFEMPPTFRGSIEVDPRARRHSRIR